MVPSRKLFLPACVLLALAFPLLAWAKPVQEKEAVQAARAWLHANPTPGVTKPSGKVWKAGSARRFKSESGDLLAYVIDLDPAGFVVVSADDTVEPVVAFNPTGRFDFGDDPCNHLALLLRQDIPDFMKQHGKASKEYRDELADKWNKLRKAGADLEATGVVPQDVSIQTLTISVPPIVATQWDQSGDNDATTWSYNLYTPNHYFTGCAATAMAQIVRHHAYPARVRGTDVVYWQCYWTRLTATYDNTFDYTQMPDKLVSTTPANQVQQVARLSQDCGIALHMDYCSNGSGAQMEYLAPAYTDYFRYKSAEWYSNTDWGTKLRAELSAGYPVEMGIRSSTDVGHAIVCDGWGISGSTYCYHLNMGWGGSDDNWYFVPGFWAGGEYWSSMKGLVYNIRPGDTVLRVKQGSAATNPNGTSWSKAYPSISDALLWSAKPCDVWVAKGSYSENLQVPDGVSLFGGFAGWETALSQRNPKTNVTTIDGGSKGTTVWLKGTSESYLDGFTIKGGKYGGAGGAVYAQSPLSVVRRNIITESTAGYGGAIYCIGSPKILGNVIYGNTATALGAGICGVNLTSNAVIASNTIFSNTATTNGGGMYFTGASSPVIGNNIIAHNSSGIYLYSGTLNLTHNDVPLNTAYQYSGVSAGATDISSDPWLVSPTSGNYHILSWSPCVNAGDGTVIGSAYLNYDMDWQARYNGTIDIGADESYGESYSAVYYVKQNSPGPTFDGKSWNNAFHTIQAGIDAASGAGGGEVWVAAGAYLERITMKDKVRLFGGFLGDEQERDDRDPRVRISTIDGNQGGTVVTFPSGVTNAALLDGFTIQNGKGSSSGGIYCNSSSPIISNNTITANTGQTNGGGVTLYMSSTRLENNTVIQNTSSGYGGGVYQKGGSPVLIGNLICGNTASLKGGGVSFYGSGSPTLTNNTIAANTAASNGGGICCEGAITSSISNNIVIFNNSGIYGASGPTLTLRNNDVYGNTSYNYSGVSAGTGDISADPLFANRVMKDRHIRSMSPCRNAGLSTAPGITASSLDIDGQARIEGTAVDIGADESYGEVYSAIHRVKESSPQNGPGDSWSRAWRSLSTALAYAAPGDEIWVASGTYIGSYSVTGAIGLYGGFAGTETSRVGRNMRANLTTLTSAGEGNVLTLDGPGSAVVEGFTITGGRREAGAGIMCRNGSTAAINANVITANQGDVGAGIACIESDATITNNIIKANTGAAGAGGIYVEHCDPQIVNNVITGNTGNQYGGAMQLARSAALVLNNIISGNGPGVWTDGEPTIIYNCFYKNKEFDLYGRELDRSNLRTDPLVVDSANGDYHLKSGSPCIDHGSNSKAPAYDKDGFVRPQDANGDGRAVCDVGAYESAADMAAIKSDTPDDVAVTMGNVCVTAVFADEDMIYVEKPDRSVGIRVYTDGTFYEGQIVNVTGTMDTSLTTGERAIWASKYELAGGSRLLHPIGMPIRTLGGGTWGLQVGVEQGFGLNNIGLLVRVSGRITRVGDYYASLDDGSGVPLRVLSPVEITFPIPAEYVSITGIASCGRRTDGTIYRVLRPRKTSDIVPYY